MFNDEFDADDHYKSERVVVWFAVAIIVLVLLTAAWCWWHGYLT